MAQTLSTVAPDRAEIGGPLRRLDPRGRVLAALAFALVTVSLSTLPALAAALILGLVTLKLAHLPLAATLRKVAAVDGFIVALLLMLPFTMPGRPLAELGPLSASAEGLHLAVVIALKANAVVMALLALVGSLDAGTLGHALSRLGLPDKLVHLLLFTVRYIDVLCREFATLRLAMRARGFRPGSNRHTYRSLGQLIGMMVVRSLERAERIQQAMKCRGFTGRFPCLDTLAFSHADVLFAGIAVTLLAFLLIVEHRPWTP